MAHARRSSRPSASSDADSSLYDERLDDPFPFEYSSRNQHHSIPETTPSLRTAPRTRRSWRTNAWRNAHPVRYAFAQAFGELCPDPTSLSHDADIISAVRFNDAADMIASGDRAGRIVVLKRASRNPDGNPNSQSNNESFRKKGVAAAYEPSADITRPKRIIQSYYPATDIPHIDANHRIVLRPPPEYCFWTQFQSHLPQFDYLKSMEIDEKINQIRWCRPVSGTHRFLSTNDKVVKLWRVYEKDLKRLVSMDHSSISSRLTGRRQYPQQSTSSAFRIPHSPQSPQSVPLESNSNPRRPPLDASSLPLPRLESRGYMVCARQRRSFTNSHSYHINSISLSSDEETFLSADDLRVNLWNMNRNGSGCNILDIKPGNMDDLAEVITSAEFHPQHCHLFTHSTSRGVVRICDMRSGAMCRKPERQFRDTDSGANRNSFFSEIISSISDVKFSPDGQFLLTRDYMHLRLWDSRNERAPVLIIPVHDHLWSRLCDLYENDCIFDKFECGFSGDGGSLLTGSYDSMFHAYSAYDGSGMAVEASLDAVTGLSSRQRYGRSGYSASLASSSSEDELIDPMSRILHFDSSPQGQVAAVAAGAALYLYHGMCG